MRRATVGLGAVIVLVLAVGACELRRQIIHRSYVHANNAVRTMLAAQAAYASRNGGFFDEPRCLGAPSRCLPDYSADKPPFLEAALASLDPDHGYDRKFYAGLTAPAEVVAKGRVSSSSVSSWAYVVTPTSWLQTLGLTVSLCGDSRGMMCLRYDGTMPPARYGRCPEQCLVMG